MGKPSFALGRCLHGWIDYRVSIEMTAKAGQVRKKRMTEDDNADG